MATIFVKCQQILANDFGVKVLYQRVKNNSFKIIQCGAIGVETVPLGPHVDNALNETSKL
jgi:hypothetical protein